MSRKRKGPVKVGRHFTPRERRSKRPQCAYCGQPIRGEWRRHTPCAKGERVHATCFPEAVSTGFFTMEAARDRALGAAR